MKQSDLVTQLSNELNLPPGDVSDEIQFVLGTRRAPEDQLVDADVQRVQSYFYSIHAPQSMMGGVGITSPDAEETFSRLNVSGWRQFRDVDIDLSSRLTVLTGENGTGKTTLLSLLGQAFGEQIQFMGTPTRDKDGFRFRAGRRKPTGNFEPIGHIAFRSGSSSRIGVREWAGVSAVSFSPELAPYRNLPGLYLDAQRVIGPYQQLESMPPRFKQASEIASEYKQQLRNLWIPHQALKSPSLLIKEALVAAAMWGEGNSNVVGDPRAALVWGGFQDILRRLFPTSLGFEQLQVDQGELLLKTRSGSFALEAASGGLSAIVTLAWQIYLHAVESPDAFTVCFDEPENHLHPSLQRTLLPSLLEAFPSVNFIVATHSPFVVTSTRDASVFALRRDQDGFVYSTAIDFERQAYTADEILDEVLGVGVTLPLWAEQQLSRALDDFRAGNETSVVRLVERLDSLGLRISTPDVSDAVTSAIEDAHRGDRG